MFIRRQLAWAAESFVPFSWSEYHWQWFSSFKKFALYIVFVVFTLMAEFDAFFLFHIFK